MTLPASGDISIGDLATEFGVSLPKSLGNFYRGGGIVPAILQTVGVPASGDIELGDFYGKGKETGLTTWQAGSMTTVRDWKAAAYGNGVFVAVSNVAGDVKYSSDGITWADGTSPSSSSYASAICYGNGRFVCVPDTGAKPRYSADGITWVNATGSTLDSWRDVTYGNGVYVAVRNNGFGSGDNYMTSPTGAAWTNRAGPAQDVTTVAFGAGLFVALSGAGTLSTYTTSPDGVTWTSRTLPVSGNWKSVRFGVGKFVAIPVSGSTGLYSTDGLSWSTFTLPASGAWTALSAGPYGFFAAVYGGTQAASSADGVTWTSRTLAAASNWTVSMQGLGIGMVIGTGTGYINLSYT